MVPANTPPYKIDHSGDMKKNAGPKFNDENNCVGKDSDIRQNSQ